MAEADGPAWRGLAARTLEPNIFAELDFMGSALKHGGQARRVALLAIWQGPALRGLLPFTPPRLPFAAEEARLWRPDLAASGPPLIDRGAPEAVLEAMLDGLAQLGPSHAALVLPEMPSDGALSAALRNVAERTGRRLESSNAFERAVLRSVDGAVGASDEGPTATGTDRIPIESARDPRAIRDAVEEFLALEARVAQGRKVPALIEQPGAVLVVSTLTRELARSRRCRVDLLRSGERVVAGAITLRSGDRAWLWRIVGEPGRENAAARSLAWEIARAQAKRRSVVATLSCFPVHATAGLRLGRETVADFSIATRPDARKAAPLGRSLRRAWRGVAGHGDGAA